MTREQDNYKYLYEKACWRALRRRAYFKEDFEASTKISARDFREAQALNTKLTQGLERLRDACHSALKFIGEGADADDRALIKFIKEALSTPIPSPEIHKAEREVIEAAKTIREANDFWSREQLDLALSKLDKLEKGEKA